jgi:hypothetical protein
MRLFAPLIFLLFVATTKAQIGSSPGSTGQTGYWSFGPLGTTTVFINGYILKIPPVWIGSAGTGLGNTYTFPYGTYNTEYVYLESHNTTDWGIFTPINDTDPILGVTNSYNFNYNPFPQNRHIAFVEKFGVRLQTATLPSENCAIQITTYLSHNANTSPSSICEGSSFTSTLTDVHPGVYQLKDTVTGTLLSAPVTVTANAPTLTLTSYTITASLFAGGVLPTSIQNFATYNGSSYDAAPSFRKVYPDTIYFNNSAPTVAVNLVKPIIITPNLSNITVGAASNTICPNTTATITTPSSQTGKYYVLEDNTTGTRLNAPTLATGGALNMITTPLSSSTTIRVKALQELRHLRFDGIDDYINTPATLQGSSGSWEAWVQKDNWANHHDDQLFTNGIDFTSNGSMYASLHPAVGFHFRYGGQGQTGNNYVSTLVTQGFAANSWHHLAATWQNVGGNTLLSLYVDGVFQASATCSSFVLGNSSNIKLGGSGINAATTYFGAGNMYDTRLWNVAKSASEISTSYFKELTGSETGLIANYKLNQTTGNTATDASLNNNNGILTNFTLPQAWDVSSSCNGTSFILSQTQNIVVGNFYTWKTNAASSNWQSTANWGCALVPTSTDSVSVLAGSTTMPTITGNTIINKLYNTGSITLTDASTLSITNHITGNGSITASLGDVAFTGIAAQSIANKITTNNLTINNATGVSLLDTVKVSGVLAPTAGILNTGDKLILQSNATNTARIANSAGTISGNVTQERFIPAKSTRRFSFIASPVSQALSAAWQQQIHITGAGTGGTNCPSLTAHSNGFDATLTNAPSMFSYNASNASGSRWVANTTGTTSFTLTPGTGYRLNVRGARSIGCSLLDGTAGGLIPTAVTLSATGAVNNASKNAGSFSNTYNNNVANNWVLIGNPYPSEIDFTAFRTTNSSVINASYIIYDPQNAPNNVTPANMYSTWNAGTWSNAATSISNANGQYIANGQAFFVQAQAASNITLNFTEAHKYNGTQNGVFRTTPTWNDIVRIAFKKDAVEIDQTVIRYSTEATVNNTKLGNLDATLLSSSNSYLGTLKAGNLTSIQTRSLQQVQSDSVQLDFNVSETGSYHFNFSEHEQFTTANIYLLDNYTNTTTAIKANPVYNFSVDKAITATQTNRFVLVFNKAIVPVVIQGIKMYPNPANKQLTVELPITEGKYTVKITEITGKQVYQNQLAAGVQAINISQLSQGNYVVEITDSKGKRMVEKLVKQ